MTEERTQYTTQPDELTQLRTENWNLRQQLDRQIAAWNANGDALTAHAARQAQRIAELEAQLAAVPVDAIRAWWKSPVSWTGYDHTKYTEWHQAVKRWLATLDGAA